MENKLNLTKNLILVITILWYNVMDYNIVYKYRMYRILYTIIRKQNLE